MRGGLCTISAEIIVLISCINEFMEEDSFRKELLVSNEYSLDVITQFINNIKEGVTRVEENAQKN